MIRPYTAWKYRNVEQIPDLDIGVHEMDEPVYAYKGVDANIRVDTKMRGLVTRVVIPEGATVVAPTEVYDYDMNTVGSPSNKWRTDELFVQRPEGITFGMKSSTRRVRRGGCRYPLWTYVQPDGLDTNVRRICSKGLHFCRTKEDAREWGSNV